MLHSPWRTASRLAGAAILIWNGACSDSTGPGRPTRLVFVEQPQSGSALAPLSVHVAIEDDAGHIVTSAHANIVLTLAAGSTAGIAGTTLAATSAGVAPFPGVRITKAGQGYAIRASADGLASATSEDFAISPGPPDKLAFLTQPGSVIARLPMSLMVVAVQDAVGNNVTGASYAVTLALASNTTHANLTGVATRQTFDGVVNFTSIGIDTPGQYVFSANAAGLNGATSATFSVTVGPAASLAFTVQPGTTRTGHEISPAVTVEVRDVAGNRATLSSPITLAFASNAGEATLYGPRVVTPAGGVAVFPGLSVDEPGTYTLRATATGLVSGVSAAFEIVAGPPVALAFVNAPQVVSTGVIMPVVRVALRDDDGVATSAGGTVTLSLTRGGIAVPLGGTTTADAFNGAAVFDNLFVTQPAPDYVLTASSPGLASAATSPFVVRDPLVFESMSAGYFHTCGIVAGGTPYCWGGIVDQVASSGMPVAISNTLRFSSLGSGRTHTCGMSQDGSPYCWGENYEMQLGVGSSFPVFTASPVPVAGGLAFATVTGGYAHSCGLTLTGAAYCWGDNLQGELGDGSLVTRNVPTAVAGGLKFSMISAGRYVTCGVTTAGAAYCWGDNSANEVGDGTNVRRTTPALVVSSQVFTSVGAGGFSSCGLTVSGAVYCWGQGSAGQLGNGGTGNSSLPVLVSGNLVFTALTVGNRHACGLTAAGKAFCWGDNSSREIGDGGGTNRATPTPVFGSLVFRSISAGRFHTCGVTIDGAGYCWGSSVLGDGSSLSAVPVRVR